MNTQIVTAFIASILIFMTACKTKKDGYPPMKDLKLKLADSVTIFNTEEIPEGQPFIFVFFDPDCKECQEETEDLIAHKDELQKYQIYFITDVSFSRLKVFEKVYKIQDHSNYVLLHDYERKFHSKYYPRGSPYSIIFDENKKMRTVFSGQAPIKLLIQKINELDQDK